VQVFPVISALKDGGFVVAWESTQLGGSSPSVFGRRYAADGTALGIPFLVNKVPINGQYRLGATGLGDGGFIILWSSVRSAALDIFGQIFDATGNRFNIEFRVNRTITGNQWQPAVTSSGVSGFVAAWASRDQDGSLEGVYGHRFNRAR
jgi:hypothetical protein